MRRLYWNKSFIIRFTGMICRWRNDHCPILFRFRASYIVSRQSTDTTYMNKNRISGERPETNSKLKIGTHLSVAKGYTALARDAVKIGANTLDVYKRQEKENLFRTAESRICHCNYDTGTVPWRIYLLFVPQIYKRTAFDGEFQPGDSKPDGFKQLG